MHEFEYIPDIDYEVKEDWSIAIYEKSNAKSASMPTIKETIRWEDITNSPFT